MEDLRREVTSKQEKIYQERQKKRSEELFCRKCVRFFASKSEFCHHVKEHIEETSHNKTHYMSYIEKYICTSCGEQFQVKSDLIIHYNSVCLDAAYTCKHCKENCENNAFLQMHLVVHHKYSEEMLLDEGFFTNIDNNPFVSENSFIKSSRYKAFRSPTSDYTDAFHTAENSTLSKTESYINKSSKFGRKCQNYAYNSVNKAHICGICNESFSRKCVLDIHTKKHFLKNTKKRKMPRGISKTASIMKPCENTVERGKDIDSAVVSGQHSKSLKVILKPCNVGFCSPSEKKVIPQKSKVLGVKGSISARSKRRKCRISAIFEDKMNDSRTHKHNTRQSDMVADNSAWKKVNLRSRIPNFIPSYKQINPEVTNKQIKLRNKKLNIGASVEQENDEALKKHVKRRSKIKNVAASDEQKDPETSNTAAKSKSGEDKKRKKPQQNVEKKDYVCETCKREFKDKFKLKRHLLIHTGEKPYTCTKCKKAFARSDHMNRHQKRVCNKTGNSE